MKNKKHFLNSSLSEFPFSVRTYNSLKRAECETLHDVIKGGRKRLLLVDGFGKASLTEVEKILRENNCIEIFKE